jgi:hypothetical protein
MFSLTQTKGSIPIAVSFFPDEAAERAVLAVEQMLLKAGAGEVSRAGLQVFFRTSFLNNLQVVFCTDFFDKLYISDFLYNYNRGVVKIEPNAPGITVRYCLSSARWAAIVTAIFTAFILAAYVLVPGFPSIQELAFLLLIWLWPTFGNIITGGVRFRNWLSRGIRRKLRAERESWVDAPTAAIVDFLTAAMISALPFIAFVLICFWLVFHRISFN